MATPSSSATPLASLINCGSTLATLLGDEARGKSKTVTDGKSYDKMRKCIGNILEDLEGGQDSSFAQESVDYVLAILEKLLRKLAEVDKDNGSSYEELTKRLQSQKQQSSSPVDSSSSSAEKRAPITGDSSIANGLNLQESEKFEEKYNTLTNDEKRCLFYLSMFPEREEIKKRELIHWLLGMMSSTYHSDVIETECELVLANLVEKGFIKRTSNHTTASNQYIMLASVRSKVIEQAAKDFALQYLGGKAPGSEKVLFSLHYVGEKKDSLDQLRPQGIEALLNIDVHTFNSDSFNWISKMKSVLVLHLGSWRGNQNEDGGHYIVIEDIDPLQKALKNLGTLRFLSLEGIYGIVELPDSIYELENLLVLDLRACNNLESLPKGIGSLRQLTHLDLSECHLLEHIPKDITALSNLRVLKGFVVNSELDHDSRTSEGSSRGKVSANSCAFNELSCLSRLRKLTIRTMRIDFPRSQDIQTLCKLFELRVLRISWVERSTSARTHEYLGTDFPILLKKLELQAVPENTAWQLFEVIMNKQQQHSLEKVYIRGALGKLKLDKYEIRQVKQVRLRYLKETQLQMDRQQFIRLFPDFVCFQTLACPGLVSFPCDENGVWKRNIVEQ